MYLSFRMHVDSGFVFGPIIVITGLSISCIPWRNRSQSWPRQPEYGLLFRSRPQWADHRYHPGYCVFICIWCLAKNIVAKQSLDAFGLESSNFFGLCMKKGRYRHSPHKHLYQPVLLGSEGNLKVAFHESHHQLIEKPAQSMSDVIDVLTALMARAQTESDTIPT